MRTVRTSFDISEVINVTGSTPLLGEVLVQRGIIHPIVNASVLTWFIKYIIIIEINHPKTCTPPSVIGDLSRCWLSCLGTLVFLPSKTFKLFSFQISCLWAYLMRVIQKRVVRTKLDIWVFRQSFITDHFPYINNNIEESKQWQLLENPLTLEVYSKSIKPSEEARHFGI